MKHEKLANLWPVVCTAGFLGLQAELELKSSGKKENFET
jgi:hypothetical protein